MTTYPTKVESRDSLETVSSEPRLYVLSRPLLDLQEFSKFLEDETTEWKQTSGATDAENITELAGRICYMSFGSMQSPKSNLDYIKNLISQGHESVLEHVAWTFLLTGVSRAFTHQFVRHRIGFSFSQLSQQYHDETMAKFVVPEEVKSNLAAMDLWIELIEEVRRGYRAISNALEQDGSENYPSSKEKRRALLSAARSILPNATETKLIFSANGRALRHFLLTRGAIVGDLEMRRVSALIYSRIVDEAPALLFDFEVTTLEDGHPVIRRRAC